MPASPRRATRWGRALAASVAAGALLVAVGAAGAAPKQPAALGGMELQRADFETGDFTQWDGKNVVADRSARIVRSPVRQGRYSARFEVRRGDNPIGFGDRAQVALGTDESEGQVRAYRWSTLFAKSFPTYDGWQVVAQWHAKADGSPPLAFYVDRDSLILKANRFSSPGRRIDEVELWRGPLLRGRWRDIGVRARWSGSDARGWVELWIDGRRQRLDDGSLRRRIRTMYPGIENYFVLGYYRQFGLRGTGIVYHDGFRMTRGGRP